MSFVTQGKPLQWAVRMGSVRYVMRILQYVSWVVYYDVWFEYCYTSLVPLRNRIDGRFDISFSCWWENIVTLVSEFKGWIYGFIYLYL